MNNFYKFIPGEIKGEKIDKNIFAYNIKIGEYSVTSEPLNPLHRATHSECRSHPYEKVNPLLRATS